MPLTLSVALIAFGAIVLVGLVGYWIDEAEETVERAEPTSPSGFITSDKKFFRQLSRRQEIKPLHRS